MSTPVVLKSNRYGINLILDSEMDFEELLDCIAKRFQESAGFFKDARLAISFEGRELAQEEEFRIVETITGNSSIDIICILDNDILREEMVRQKIEQFEEEQSGRNGEFYRGTLRSGQVLDCESSIVILGDINPGAKIRIGDVIARSADKTAADRTLLGRKRGKKKPEAAEPQVAIVKDGNIYIEPITKGLLNSI